MILPRTPSTSSLLGKPQGELILRFQGGEHDGQVVRLRAGKCTIGSAAGCTLRLRSAAIAPVHCLVLRGPGGVVVRRWSRQTLLDGGAFIDAPLPVGSVLFIGPVRLERCPDQSTEPARDGESGAAGDLEMQRRLERTQAEATRWESEAASLQEQLATLESTAATAQTDLDAKLCEFEATCEQLRRELADRDAAAGRSDAALQQRLDEALEEVCRWESEAASLQEQLATLESTAATAQTDLDAKLCEFEATCEQLRRELADRGEAELASRSALQRKVDEALEEAARWESEATASSEGLESPDTAGSQPPTEQLQELEATCEQLRRELAARQQASETAEGKLRDELATRNRAAEDVEQLQQQLAEATAEAARAKAEADELRGTVDELAEQVKAELSQSRRIKQTGATSHRQTGRDGGAARSSTAQTANPDASYDDAAAQYLQRLVNESENLAGANNDNDNDNELPLSINSTISLDYVPLVSAPVEAADETSEVAAEQEACAVDQPVENEPAPPVPQVMESSAVPAATSRAAADDPPAGEDDSVDAYMARLLRRVRGDSVAEAYVNPPAAASPDPPTEPAASDVSGRGDSSDVGPAELASDASPIEHDAPQAKPTTPPIAPMLPVGEERRARAKELATDLSAMRELANESARLALDESYQRRLKSAVSTKTITTVIAFSAAVLLWALAPRLTEVFRYGAWAAVLVGGISAVQTVIRYRLLRLAEKQSQEGADEASIDSAD